MRIGGAAALSVVLAAAAHRLSSAGGACVAEAFSPSPYPPVSSTSSRFGPGVDDIGGGTSSAATLGGSSLCRPNSRRRIHAAIHTDEGRDIMGSRRQRRSRVALAAAASTNNNVAQRPAETTQEKPAPTNKPWEADYRTSMATQRRIKAAGGQDDRNRNDRGGGRGGRGSGRMGGRGGRGRGRGRGGRGRGQYNNNNNNSNHPPRPPMQLAVDALATLLDTPAERCNAANLVCSLTLSAKLVANLPPMSPNNNNNNNDHFDGGNNNRNPRQRRPPHAHLAAQFRSLRDDVLAVLGRLVEADLLSPRQLCNAAWAVGKHHAYDGTILPGSGGGSGSGGGGTGIELGMRERWDVNGENSSDGSSLEEEMRRQTALAQTMDQIAIRLTELLDRHDDDVIKVGELTMACWAYASTRPRAIPPGWELPPRVGRVPDDENVGSSGAAAALASAAAIGGGGGAPGGANAVATEANTILDGPMDDVVIFERLDQITAGSSSSSSSNRKQARAESRSDIIVDDLFDAVANVLCKERRVLTENEVDAHTTTTLLRQCPWKDLSTIAWSYATRGHFNSRSTEYLFDAAVQEATRRLDEAPRGVNRSSRFLPRDVSQLAWAVAVLQSDNHRMGNSLVELVGAINRHWIGLGVDKHYDARQRPFENWKPADLVQLAVALSHGRIDDISLLSEIYNEALHIIRTSEDVDTGAGGGTNNKGANGQSRGVRTAPRRHRQWQTWELSIMLWVQANLYLTSKDDEVFRIFAEAVPETILRRIKHSSSRGNDFATLDTIGLGAQEQANMAWSLTVLQEHFSEDGEELLRHIFQSATSSYRSGAFIRLENAHQLWQSYYLAEVEYPDAVADVTQGFRDYLERTWNQEKSRRKISSARHKSLSQTLDLMGVAHYNEHDEDIDVAIILKSESAWTHTAERGDHKESHHKVAVEFDGPNHFTRAVAPNKPRALGHTVLKYRILKRQGWTVVRVPFFEFDKIPFWASMERQRYLQRLLKTHADIRFSEVDVSEYKPIVPSRKSRFD